MTSKIEARRFSGKPGTWAHYEMAVKAHLAVVDLLEFLHDGDDLEEGGDRANWVKGQQKIYSHFILTCDDRAATTLLSIDATQPDCGWQSYCALRDKYGDAKDRQLSKLIKKFYKRKQQPDEPTSEYLNDMRALQAQIERVAANDTDKIWRIMKCTALIQNLEDTPDTKLTKKLVTNRMAEAEANKKPLEYDAIESIIEQDAIEDDKGVKTKKKADESADLLLYAGKGKDTQGQWGKGQWTDYWSQPAQPYSYNQYGSWNWGKGKKGKDGKGGKGKADFGKGKPTNWTPPDSASSLEVAKSKLKQMQTQYNEMKKKSDAAYNASDQWQHGGQWQAPSASTSAAQPKADEDGYWSMYDSDKAYSVEQPTHPPSRDAPPIKGSNRDVHAYMSKKLGQLPTMQACIDMLQTYLHVPDEHELKLITVDSGCTVTNINHGSIIPPDRRMTASRGIEVASKGSSPIFPEYEGYGSIATFGSNGSIKEMRMGRCIRARTHYKRPTQCLEHGPQRP